MEIKPYKKLSEHHYSFYHIENEYLAQDFSKVERCNNQNKVYLIYNPATGYTKIGITGNIIERTSQIRTQSGCPLYNIIHIILEEGYDENAKFIEYWLHNYFKQKKAIGEWYDLSLRDILCIRHFFWNVIEGERIVDWVKETYFDIKANNHLPPVDKYFSK